MNDFTKEDLLFIDEMMKHYHCEQPTDFTKWKRVFIKISHVLKSFEEYEKCVHYWIPQQEELLVSGHDISTYPAGNKIKCAHCGINYHE